MNIVVPSGLSTTPGCTDIGVAVFRTLVTPRFVPSRALSAATKPVLLVIITALLSLVIARPASGTPMFVSPRYAPSYR
jgi:hypothetical protein